MVLFCPSRVARGPLASLVGFYGGWTEGHFFLRNALLERGFREGVDSVDSRPAPLPH